MATRTNTDRATSCGMRVMPGEVQRLSPIGGAGAAKRIDRLRVDPLGLGQIVVMLVVGMVLAVAAVSVAVVNLFALGANAAPVHAVHIGPWTTYVSGQMPIPQVIDMPSRASKP